MRLLLVSVAVALAVGVSLLAIAAWQDALEPRFLGRRKSDWRRDMRGDYRSTFAAVIAGVFSQPKDGSEIVQAVNLICSMPRDSWTFEEQRVIRRPLIELLNRFWVESHGRADKKKTADQFAADWGNFSGPVWSALIHFGGEELESICLRELREPSGTADLFSAIKGIRKYRIDSGDIRFELRRIASMETLFVPTGAQPVDSVDREMSRLEDSLRRSARMALALLEGADGGA